MTYPRSPIYWRDSYRLAPTRYSRLHVGQWQGSRHIWRVFATDDCHDTYPTGPAFLTKSEAFAWIDSPDAADWRTPFTSEERHPS